MILLVITVTLAIVSTNARLFDEGNGAQIVYKWTKLDYDWPNDQDRQNYIRNRSFIVQNNIITGIKVFQKRVYVSVPRWRQGVPATLNEVVINSKGEAILKPFPNWSMQEIGNCNAFQYVQSMEIDPNTGQMWIIDTGSTNTRDTSGGTSRCNAKIIIYDIETKRIVQKHIFPENVVSKGRNFLNDLVIDYVDGQAKFAYISDAFKGDPKLIVYDFVRDKSYFFQHKSMYPLNGYFEIVTGNKLRWNATIPIDGIAMSPDFKFVYYCTLADRNLYRIATHILRSHGNFSHAVQLVGQKNTLSDGMIFSQNSLYFGSMEHNMVYKHTYIRNLKKVIDFGTKIQPVLSQELPSLEWVDGFSIDETGSLWFVANRLLHFNLQTTESNNSVTNDVYIWKINIAENSYLWNAKVRTIDSNTGTNHKSLSNKLIILCIIIAFIYY